MAVLRSVNSLNRVRSISTYQMTGTCTEPTNVSIPLIGYAPFLLPTFIWAVLFLIVCQFP